MITGKNCVSVHMTKFQAEQLLKEFRLLNAETGKGISYWYQKFPMLTELKGQLAEELEGDNDFES